MNTNLYKVRFFYLQLIAAYITEMNVTDQGAQDMETSHFTSMALAIVSSICVLVDAIYIVVCFKALKQTFHHLQILGLCFSDAFLSIPTAVYAFSKMASQLKGNIGLCRFQIFLIFYGLLLQYSFQLLLCLRRFYALKTFNFGSMQKRLENSRFIISLITMTVPFIFETTLALLIPHEDNVQDCSPPNLYGPYYRTFISFNLVPITSFMITIVTLYLFGAFVVWKKMINKKIIPAHNNRMPSLEDKRDPPIEIGYLSYKPTSSNQELASSTKIDYNFFSVTELKPEYPNPRKNLESEDSDNNKEACSRSNSIVIETISLVDIELASEHETSSVEKQVKAFESRFDDTKKTKKSENKAIMSSNKESQKQVYSSDTTKNPSKMSKGADRIAWELHAFITCVIIAIQTISLTGPLMFGFWSEVITNRPLGLNQVFILSIPYLFNSLSNPFIYFWRVPEIRQAFKQLFRNQPSNM